MRGAGARRLRLWGRRTRSRLSRILFLLKLLPALFRELIVVVGGKPQGFEHLVIVEGLVPIPCVFQLFGVKSESTPKIGTGQVALVHVGSAQVGVFHNGPSQISAVQIRSAQAGSAQIGTVQVGSVKLGTA